MNHPSTSLKNYCSRQIVRWTLLGALGSAGLSLLVLIYVSISSCEDHILIASQSAAKAFRPQILSDYAKDTELQIQDAFHLRTGEKAILRDENMKRIYLGSHLTPSEDTGPSCSVIGKVCWRLAQWQLSTLVPIYFDSERTEIKGYLEMVLHPQLDLTLMVGLFFALCMGSLIQIQGLSSRFLGVVAGVGDQLNSWAKHIRQNPKGRIERQGAPLEELEPMLDALCGLNEEISRLEEKARDSAKIAVIRGISHDILSPVSQLKKYTTVLSQQKQKGKLVSDEILAGFERSLKRLSALAKQARYFHLGEEAKGKPDDPCELIQATKDLLRDLPFDPEFSEKNITVRAALPEKRIFARIDRDHYERILDNLVRNAARASSPNSAIDISISNDNRKPILFVRDAGHGIAPEIQPKIFDLNFTTRPSSGTGLGLAIVKQLCEQNDALISFSSELGTGTEFRIQFDRSFLSLEAV